jgi:uncharacterized protein (TIGR00375 family)
MRLVADLHVHSRYSRATSREADLEGYYRWARLKGINVVGTGDFTHPRWMTELEQKLVEKDGLFLLREPPRDFPLEVVPSDSPVRFLLTVEISSIYKKRGATRKVHSLLGVRTMEEARRLGARLAAIGNVASDGRPILGLDPKDLLSILLETSPDGFLIPAHVWTPWFSIFGSKSGFDRIEDCFEDLTPHIFALETGLSSDPPMNWRWSALDAYRLVSNSDAHSPPNLGREATVLDAELGWDGVVDALRTGKGFVGTCEFYPEEGKYHFDGHRKCGVCLDPEETLRTGNACPACGAPVTVGVLHRVLELADRQAPRRPQRAGTFRYLIPVPEILGQLTGSGAGSRAVAALHAKVIRTYGSEYAFLFDAAPQDIERTLGSLIAEAVRRMRDGRVTPTPGYDGEFGVIRMFDPQELARLRGQDELFPVQSRGSGQGGRVAREGTLKARSASEAPALTDSRPPSLDQAQRAVVELTPGKSLVLAGPGTGKTLVLTSWIARQIEVGLAAPQQVLALTFTTRAASEMRERLSALLGGRAAAVSATTFHSFCFGLLRERNPGLVTVYNASQRVSLLRMLPPLEAPSLARAAAEGLERYYEGMQEPDSELAGIIQAYEALCESTGGVDVSSLVIRALDLVRKDRGLLAQGRFTVVAVDELQDINTPQFELLSAVSENALALLCIGDPDQAIYGFRGSDRRLFFRFRDQPDVRQFALIGNYRSSSTVARAAAGIIAPQREPGAPLPRPLRPAGPAVRVFAAADPAQEGDYIASCIRDLVGGVDSVSVDAARSRLPGTHSFADIAVLFRTRAVRDALLPSLLRAGLPLAFRDNSPLVEEAPFNLLIAALRLVVNPADPVSRRELAGGLSGFLERLDGLRVLAASRGIEAVIDELENGLVRVDRSVPETALADEAIRESAREQGSDLPSFLSRLSLLTRESEGARRVERVTLLTFHASKGLEFPVVFIAGAEEGIVPMKDDPDEERRLFYVALTRARDFLAITHCAQRTVHGVVTAARPSPFLAEIPPDCLQAASRRHGAADQLTLFG